MLLFLVCAQASQARQVQLKVPPCMPASHQGMLSSCHYSVEVRAGGGAGCLGCSGADSESQRIAWAIPSAWPIHRFTHALSSRL